MGKSRRNYEVNGEMELTESVRMQRLAPDSDQRLLVVDTNAVLKSLRHGPRR
jgi:hypothetical protein